MLKYVWDIWDVVVVGIMLIIGMAAAGAAIGALFGSAILVTRWLSGL